MNSKDLSNFHEPISSIFKMPENDDDWQAFKLNDDQIEFFHENGYLSGIQLLNEKQIQTLRNELTNLTDPNHPGHKLFYEFHSNESADPNTVIFHALGHWRITPGFHDVLWNPQFRMAAKQLLNGAVRFWHDQIFSKPSKHGGVVAWHQDYSYWTRTIEMNHLTCWIALDDADEENGCLQYIPKSHHWGLLEKPNLTGEMNGLKKFMTTEQIDALDHPVPVVVKAGQCSFHHPLMVHGSNANYTERSRRAFVINVFKDGVISNSNETLLNGVPVIPKGEKMDGQFFPLLLA